MNEASDCYLQGIKLLSRREYSEKKLATKLLTKGFEPEEVLETFQELRIKNYLNDDRYKKAKIRYHLMRNMGPFYILNKIREEGLCASQEEIEEIAQENSIHLDEIQTKLVKQKLQASSYKKERDKQKTLHKIHYFLTNRGFRVDLAKINEIIKDFDAPPL